MKSKTIIFNGCSLTWGSETTKDNSYTIDDHQASYPFKLGEINKSVNIVNIAAPGSGNSRIFCSNVDYLYQHIDKKDDLIFVTQWTDPNRILNPKDVRQMYENKRKDMPWFSSLYETDNTFTSEIFWNQTIAQVISWHRLCESYGIKNLSWLMLDVIWDRVQKKYIEFFKLKSPNFIEIHEKVERISKRKWWKTPVERDVIYDLSNIYDYMEKSKSFILDMDWLGMMDKFGDGTRAGGHPTEVAHEKWANILNDYMTEHKFYD